MAKIGWRRGRLVLLVVVCLAALTATSVYADGLAAPLRATDILGSPDAAVDGKFAVGSASVGDKALTVSGVIDFLGAGTVHNYFSQGPGNNMQINTNVDEANVVGNASNSQWKLVLGSDLDQFSIRRSPAGGAYDEEAMFFIDGDSGDVGIATIDTNNMAAIPLSPIAKLHVETTGSRAVFGYSTATSGVADGVVGWSASPDGRGVMGWGLNTTGINTGVYGQSDSSSGRGVFGYAEALSGVNIGVYGRTASTSGRGVYGYALQNQGFTYGVFGESSSTNGFGVYGVASASSGVNYGVYGHSSSASGYGVYFSGGLAGTGTKSAIVETQDYGWRKLYAVESPGNWFEDFGRATLTSGVVEVPIDPIFAQTVNLSQPYYVFLTPRADFCSLYVPESGTTSFTVQAKEGTGCEITFDYRIIALRRDYEDRRLEPAEDPSAVAASIEQAED